jgi:hypothetical protein
MAVSVVALLAASGGLAVAASSSGPVIRACADKKTGVLRLASKCRRGERSISWNQVGPVGPARKAGATGSAGAAGAIGATGAQGLQGPGAISFATTLERGTGITTLATFSNGLKAVGECLAGGEEALLVETADGSNHLEASGTLTFFNTVQPGDTEATRSLGGFDVVRTDVDVIAQNTAVGKFGRVDIHGSAGPSCKFWGMFIPAS